MAYIGMEFIISDWDPFGDPAPDDDDHGIVEKKRKITPPIRIGATLVEVLAVVIDNTLGQDRHIYGRVAIRVTTDGFIFIYKRTKGESELIKAGEFYSLLLNGPDSHFWGFGCIEIVVDLKDRDTDEIFSHGTVIWDMMSGNFPFDTLLGKFVREGRHDFEDEIPASRRFIKDGDVRVHCICMDNSTLATLGVTFTGEVANNVYGDITAWNDCYGKHFESVLFRKEVVKGTQDGVDENNKVISVLRPHLVVQFNSKLVVDANLHNRAKEEIAVGSLTFDINAETGESIQKVGGIDVKVTWSFNDL